MMKYITLILLFIMTSGYAEDTKHSFYTGIHFNHASYELSSADSNSNIDFSTNLLNIHFGYQFNQYLSGELHAGTGISDDQTNFALSETSSNSTAQPSTSLQSLVHNSDGLYSAFIKAHYPINTRWQVYGLLGYSHYQFSQTYHFLSTDSDNEVTQIKIDDTDSINSLSYGAGIHYFIKPQISLSFDYISYINKKEDTYRTDTISSSDDDIRAQVTQYTGNKKTMLDTLNLGLTYYF